MTRIKIPEIIMRIRMATGIEYHRSSIYRLIRERKLRATRTATGRVIVTEKALEIFLAWITKSDNQADAD